MIEKLYTVEEVAELASVTGRTIRNYLRSGRLVGRKIGGQWRFPEAEVQRLLNGVTFDDEAFPPGRDDCAPMAEFVPETSASYSAQPPSAYPLQQKATAMSPPAPSFPPPFQAQPAVLQPPAEPDSASPQPAAVRQAPYYQPFAPLPYSAPSAPAGAPPVLPPDTSQPFIRQPPVSAGYQSPQGQPAAYFSPQAAAQPYRQPHPSGGPAYTHRPANSYCSPANSPEPPPQEPSFPPPAAHHSSADNAPSSQLSEVGVQVTNFLAEVHNCSRGPIMCAVVDLHQSLPAAKQTANSLNGIADQESADDQPCQCFVEFDDRFFVARYTLFGTTAFLLRCLKLIG